MLAKLQIDFNCMCVFVPEERSTGVGTMHVLMPDTSGHTHRAGHGHGAEAASQGSEPHVVRMYHRNVNSAGGVDIEGWALELGQQMADTTLRPLSPDPDGADIVDLSDLTRRGVPRDVLAPSPFPPLAARVSLGLGCTLTARAEARWRVAGRIIRMAHRLVWHIDGLLPDAELNWVGLGGKTGDPPLRSLSEVGPDCDDVYRLSIYHVPRRTLPPDPYGVGKLDPDEVREHFRALYRLVGVTDPGPDLLPQPDGGSGGRVNCGIAKARFA